MALTLTLRPTRVLMACGDEVGCLVSVDGQLAAVLVRLDADFHGADQGSWNLEAGFGACDVRSCDPFRLLSDAVAWVADRVGAPASSALAALRTIGNGEDGPSLLYPSVE
jgi:hypothetical protein